MVFYRNWYELLQGLGWCIRRIGGAYYSDWDGVLDGLVEPITEIGMVY
jgi:hypothetical protein